MRLFIARAVNILLLLLLHFTSVRNLLLDGLLVRPIDPHVLLNAQTHIPSLNLIITVAAFALATPLLRSTIKIRRKSDECTSTDAISCHSIPWMLAIDLRLTVEYPRSGKERMEYSEKESSVIKSNFLRPNNCIFYVVLH